jgi:competence protein ComGC
MNNFIINYKLLSKALSIISLLIISTPLIILIIPLTLTFEQSSSTSKTTTTSTISQTKNNFEIFDRKTDSIQTNILNKQEKPVPEYDERITTDEYQEFNLENDVNRNESV